MQKVITKFEKLENALFQLEDACQENLKNRFICDATIQRFEFTFELFWKFLQEYFRAQGVQLNFPRDVFSQAYSAKIVPEEKIWLEMLKDRNLTSHTYDQSVADEILSHIKIYTPIIRKTVNYIKKNLLKN